MIRRLKGKGYGEEEAMAPARRVTVGGAYTLESEVASRPVTLTRASPVPVAAIGTGVGLIGIGVCLIGIGVCLIGGGWGY